MILNMNEPDENYIIIGNGEDVCVLCADEYTKKEQCTLSRADKVLRGRFDGEKLLKLPLNGFRATICLNHIRKIAKSFDSESEED